ncbi:MAG: L-threonylcarbamoyladenylate synthase [Phascolarctobacterium sp.]|nr:L-threonylcarbamoyladenylate synthase [Phascolarctobacterium sp.]
MKTCYWKLVASSNNAAAHKEAAAFIKAGECIAFPTETVYGLGADGLNEEAVQKIFAAKGRPNDNPLILHISKKETIDQLTTGLNNNAKAIMEHFMPGPITIIVNKSDIVPEAVSAGLPTVAIRWPSHKDAQDFITACGCPIAAPSANISGRPSPTNAQDVLEDMDGKIAGILDGGPCKIGVESTIVDTTEAIPVILRPGGITYEMLTEVLGVVEIDPALHGDPNFKPKAPGMKYRHYAPKAPVYLFEGEATHHLSVCVKEALNKGLTVGVLCDENTAKNLPASEKIYLANWGCDKETLANELFYLLRDFDRTHPDVILAQGVCEEGIGLAIMNRLRKAAGFQIVTLANDVLLLNGREAAMEKLSQLNFIP